MPVLNFFLDRSTLPDKAARQGQFWQKFLIAGHRIGLIVMLIQQDIGLIADRRIVYYPELAYFLYTTHLSEEGSLSFFMHHLHQIKLLSLFFDHIYLPPFHILTAPGADLLITNPDLQELANRGIIITIYRHGVEDIKQYVEIATEYRALLGLTSHISLNAQLLLKETAKYHRNTKQQCLNLKTNLEEWLEKNRFVFGWDEHLHSKFKDHIKRANFKDILPFSHEKFYLDVLADQTLPQHLKQEVLKESARLYLDQGIAFTGSLRYPVNQLEKSRITTLVCDETFAVFFSPAFLALFLNALGMSSELTAQIGCLSPEEIMYFRMHEHWRHFTATFFEMAESISKEISGTMKPPDAILREFRDDVLKKKFRSQFIKEQPFDIPKFILAIISFFINPFSLVAPIADEPRFKKLVECWRLRLKDKVIIEFVSELSRFVSHAIESRSSRTHQ